MIAEDLCRKSYNNVSVLVTVAVETVASAVVPAITTAQPSVAPTTITSAVTMASARLFRSNRRSDAENAESDGCTSGAATPTAACDLDWLRSLNLLLRQRKDRGEPAGERRLGSFHGRHLGCHCLGHHQAASDKGRSKYSIDHRKLLAQTGSRRAFNGWLQANHG